MTQQTTQTKYLSNEDIMDIREAVLASAKHSTLPPAVLVEELILAFNKLNQANTCC